MFLSWIESWKWGKIVDEAKRQMMLPSALSKDTYSYCLNNLCIFNILNSFCSPQVWPKWSSLTWSLRTFWTLEMTVFLLVLLFLAPLKNCHAQIFFLKDSGEWGAKAKVNAIPRSTSFLNMLWKKLQNLTGIRVWPKSHCSGDGSRWILYMLQAYSMFDCQR